MKIPVYRFQTDYVTRYSNINPLLLFAQKYEFGAVEATPLRRCYANEIVLIESGKGTLRLRNEDIRLEPGTLVYIPAGSIHRWTADSADPMVHRCVYFDWSFVGRPGFHFQRNYFTGAESAFREELIGALPDLKLRDRAKVNNIPLWVSYFNAFTPPPELLDRQNPWDSLKYNGAFQTFLHHYLAFAMLHGGTDSRITKLLQRISSEPLEACERHLYEWAAELGMGRSRFHDLFKADTGFTPKEYLQQLRLHHAAEDLSCTLLTVTDIAQKYGYSSIHYFSKAFRNVMGMTPTMYRAKHR
ncbi:helix-turn-helix domain-containing protein [Paenibacillus filicis]|uniref:Helix-turn-helix domain-containing protein n=1 Tax=Paenibacillus gyeongsangnamensis TaxID=3388067 RepID=A0ABT4QAE9_9BACL|nr:helix-turn-helix domain-containing protein [Paenibacillus filicis]MCZ8513727.1 helix-turn-helix domain-containing protein [Paenibacillus filicis]